MIADARRMLDLCGEWQFGTDPEDRGLAQHWFETDHILPNTLVVPGAWNVQGVEFDTYQQREVWERSRHGQDEPLRRLGVLGPQVEADRMRHVYPGPAWYRTQITVPDDWRPERTELVFDAVQRSATIWVDGTEVGEIIGALVPTALDVTAMTRPGSTMTVTVRVDARRDPSRDPWWGCKDTLDFLFLNWGGLYGPVRLVGTPGARIASIGVSPRLTHDEVGLTVDIERGNLPSHTELRCSVVMGDPTVDAVVATSDAPVVRKGDRGAASLCLVGQELRPWSPTDPFLYDAEITLTGPTGTLDRRTIRIGLRELAVDGPRFRLNGRPFFVRGYGDVCVFPNQLAPPHTIDAYRDRLRLAREHGFNWVRLHSWIPPEALLDAADEIGMFVQPELPTGLGTEVPSVGTHDLVLLRWRELILRYRHHPCIAAWCMGNEIYQSHPLGDELYAAAKEMDPHRLVIESDGTRFADIDRPTLDFAAVPFDEGRSCGYNDSKYDMPADDGSPTKPVIAHEVGYFATLPDPGQAVLFGSGIRPFWLDEAASLIKERGWQDRYASMIEASTSLQRLCIKTNVEAIRMSRLAGMSLWMFQDYPACAEGIVDLFGGSKGIDPAWFRQFNADTVVLAPGLAPNHVTGGTLRVSPVVSCWERQQLTVARLRAWIASSDRTLSEQQIEVTVADQLQRCPELVLPLPDVDVVTRLSLVIELTGDDIVAHNSWNIWVYPEIKRWIAAERIATEVTGDQYTVIHPAPAGGPVTVAARWSDRIARQLAEGGRVLLLDPSDLVEIAPVSFRPAAWDGSGHFGMVHDPHHPVMSRLNTSGWCDLQLYQVIEGASVMALEPAGADEAIIIRALSLADRMADRSPLAEYRVGPGKLLLSGLRLDTALEQADPCAEHLLASLIDYAGSAMFDPRTTLRPALYGRDGTLTVRPNSTWT